LHSAAIACSLTLLLLRLRFSAIAVLGIFNDAVNDISAEHVEIVSSRPLTDVLREAKRKIAAPPATHDSMGAPLKQEDKNQLAAVAAAATETGLAGSERTIVNELSLDRGISFEAASAILTNVSEEHEGPLTSFHYGTHPVTGAPMPMLAVLRANSRTQYQVYRPNTGRASSEMARSNVVGSYKPVTAAEIEAEWTKIYNDTFDRCSHGQWGETMNEGRELYPSGTAAHFYFLC
jgi:hypothetical protein